MLRLLRTLLISVACVLGIPLLAGCEEKSSVDVNIHGVNYSENTFTFSIRDPAVPNSSAGGGLIDPFGAGGIMCCFTLPKKWHPGIQVQVRTTHWLPKLPDGSLPEVKGEHLVEVPPYVDGKPGELWVLRGVDGSVSVISSDFQPDHPKWPGKVRGWPVPSREYKLRRWEIYREHEEAGVKVYLSLLDELEKEPEKRAREAWQFTQKYEPAELKPFSGPDDPNYRRFLRQDYQASLERSRKLLKQVMDAKP
jgi:hypothetical protein